MSYETGRAWVGKFELQMAKRVKAARGKPTDKWHLDEVVITIRGVKHWLWRAVDSEDQILDILVQPRRNARAARWFISRIIARWGIITDKLRSYGAALHKLALDVDHRAHKALNNRIEGSHRPTRKREKIQGCFKSARQAQRFLSVHDETVNLFRPGRHIFSQRKQPDNALMANAQIKLRHNPMRESIVVPLSIPVEDLSN